MTMGIGQEVLNVPFGEMVFQVASAISTSQTSLDKSSIEVLKMMGDKKNNPVSLPVLNADGTEGSIETSMIGAGFQPAFYQFADAIIEVKIAISMAYENEYSSSYSNEYKNTYEVNYKDSKYTKGGKYTSARTTTLNANYTSKYNFNEEASSTLRVRLVPLPPNPIMQRLVELRAQRQQLEFELKIKEAELELQKKADAVATTEVK
jgi:hypothetical protein